MIASLVVYLCGCGSNPVQVPFERAKDRAPRVDPVHVDSLRSLPDPRVVAVSPSRGGNGPIYSVFGKRYQVMQSASGFVDEGYASWYGMKFHGRMTANGERFDIYKLSAAHRHLPIPCFVRVTNLENGRKTIVRVNDRGPFHDDRIIDLSYAAAVKLGFHEQGTARVRIEVVEPPPPPPPDVERYLVQAGAFSRLELADNSQKELAMLTGLKGTVVKTPKDGLYKVQLGPVSAGSLLERIKSILQATDYGMPHLIPVP